MAAVLRCEGKPAELVLLELQSQVHMDDGSSVAGKDFGVLEAQQGGGATLTMGARTLFGKLVELPKPLVLMEKTGREEHFQGDPARPSQIFAAHGIVRRKFVFSGRPQLSLNAAGGA
mmetsp:Transcript_30135/g.70298  ORF Transcript_30135/g.70298 Transcript_30135/m.70298 type:complete len:117 (+) Transcript_30135:90-440(+)